MRRTLTGLAVGLLVALIGAVLGFSPPGTALEQQLGLSWLFKLRGPQTPPPGVSIVAIDGRTGSMLDLPALPREWPRSIHADLVDALSQRGAAVIVFDIHFAQSKDAEADARFAVAVADAANVVLVERLSGRREPISDQSGRHVGLVWTEQLLPPFPELAAAAAGLATFPLPKEAAAVSQFWVFKESADRAPTLPAVALQLAARSETGALIENLGARAAEVLADAIEPTALFADAETLRGFMRRMRAVSVATPQLAMALPSAASSTPGAALREALIAMYTGDAHRTLNFYGPPGTVQTVPYHAVLVGADPNVPAADLDFTGKVVFVGYSDLYDPGQPDRFYTVYTRDDGVDLSGVEIAATAFANLLTDRSIRPLDAWPAVGVLLAFGLVLGILAFRLPALVGVPLVFVLAAAYAYAVLQAFGVHAVLLPFAVPLLVQAPLALFLGLLGQYVLERRRGQRISAAINYYLPDEIVRDLANNRLDQSKLNQVVYATCLATDMAGFSTIAEQLPPGELASFLNEYFETLAAPLKKYGVHVTEFRADAIMCAWTAEQPVSVPRERALRAALEAAEAIRAFKDRHVMPAARLRIGLEVGYVYIGHAGGGGRFVYSIVGDSANTASRVEGLNKHIGTEILVTGAVLEGIEDVVARYVGDFQFVGKSEAVPIHEVLATKARATAEELDRCAGFAAGLQAFHAGDWATATQRFTALLETYPDDGPAAFYLARSARFATDPPADGDLKTVRMDAK